jgi:hypothetical protein
MVGLRTNHDRAREKTRRPASANSVFLTPLTGMGDETRRAVIRNDVYEQALAAAKRVLRGYYVDRKRQI